MKNTIMAVAVAASGLLVPVSAGAEPITVFDTASRTYITYDPDKVRRDSGRYSDADAAGQPPITQASVAGTISREIMQRKPDPKFDRQIVAYEGDEGPGTIIIDTGEKFLYYVLPDGQAIRMGVGVGREGFGWTGTVHVGSKQVEPKWFPPPEMVERQPELAEYVEDGMPGGPENPLGLRAIYLYDDEGKDTLYRIHGTNEPWSIGLNVSSGCIRMLNDNVISLYEMVDLGTKVIVR